MDRGSTFYLRLSSATMKLLIGVVLLCLALSCHAATHIVGGNDAPEGKYPYQVSLRFNNSHFCGGSILNNRWILTAAHCAFPFILRPTSITVVAGTTLLNGTMEQSYKSLIVLYHPLYSPISVQNDIGLIRVSKNIEFNDKVKPIGLTDKNSYSDGYPVTLTGWGRTIVNGSLPNHLQEINLKIFDQEKCKEAYKNVSNAESIKDSQICTFTSVGQGACQGDSGGPLVADGVQVGVVSFGIPCGVGYPDVYTRVYSYLDWIRIFARN